MGEGTGSAATHLSLPHCCCAAAALWPTHPPSLCTPHVGGGRASCVGDVKKRNQVAVFLTPSPLEGKQKNKDLAASRSFIWSASWSFLCAKNACKVKTRTSLNFSTANPSDESAGEPRIGAKGGHSPDFSR